MDIVVIGAGGVGRSIAHIAKRRDRFTKVHVADQHGARALDVVDSLADPSRFVAHQVDAADTIAVRALIRTAKPDVVVNACDPRCNPAIFEACFAEKVCYLDMALSLSVPHPVRPYELVGTTLGAEQLAADQAWREAGILALVGMGVEPGLADVFARYAADHLFDTIDEIGIRDGSNLSIDGYAFAPTFSIWTTLEECLNPPIVWERDRGLYTTECFSDPEVFHFPAGIGPVECVNVEHEEVILIPRSVSCRKVTFKYGLGAEFIDWLKTFAYLGLDSKAPVDVNGCAIAPRDLLAAVLPNPATLGHVMHGKTCAGTWVKGTTDGDPREVYLYHVADNDQTMREFNTQAVLWQTAVCPVVALELLDAGTWAATGVRGPEDFDPLPFLNLLADYGYHHGMVEMGRGGWPSPRPSTARGWDRPVIRHDGIRR